MKRQPRLPTRSLALVLFHLLIVCQPAHAYLTPGTFSFAIQAILGSLVVGWFTFKSFFVRPNPPDKPDAPEKETEELDAERD